MLELNKVLLTGRLTRDPDYRSTSSGRAVAQLTMAVNRRWFNRESGGAQEEVAFIDVEVWEKTAEFCKNYLHKGSAVFVEGRLKQDKWQDKESGGNRSKIVIVGERVQFAESRSEAERQGQGQGQSHAQAPTVAQPARPAADHDAAPSEPRYDGGDGESTNDDLPF